MAEKRVVKKQPCDLSQTKDEKQTKHLLCVQRAWCGASVGLGLVIPRGKSQRESKPGSCCVSGRLVVSKMSKTGGWVDGWTGGWTSHNVRWTVLLLSCVMKERRLPGALPKHDLCTVDTPDLEFGPVTRVVIEITVLINVTNIVLYLH